MPRPDHPDNGPFRLIYRETCPECLAHESYHILENLEYQFAKCEQCGHAEKPEILET